MKILTNGDLELVPWMVGITSKEGGLFPICERTCLYIINYDMSVTVLATDPEARVRFPALPEQM
jgi:hypothetical protein